MMGDFFVGMGIFGLLLGLVILIIYIWSIVWSYKDAERRGKPGWLVALLVALLSWPISLILWLIIRPSIKSHYNDGL
ncbi:hypothetical protein [Pontibacter harenae]|uniref:hypothetical protein n=1 Tax=Pontibacter harenae TaxID=2894083 RepID=UPI001E3CB1E8|nr:hypothetical protein [Pontibacter harenae]MCC9167440.1 hypothetical protein [Pontibacter harenae]